MSFTPHSGEELSPLSLCLKVLWEIELESSGLIRKEEEISGQPAISLLVITKVPLETNKQTKTNKQTLGGGDFTRPLGHSFQRSLVRKTNSWLCCRKNFRVKQYEVGFIERYYNDRCLGQRRHTQG